MSPHERPARRLARISSHDFLVIVLSGKTGSKNLRFMSRLLWSDPRTEFQHPRIKERVRSLVPSLWSVLNVLREDRGYLDVVLPLQTTLQRCHPCVRSTKQGPDEDAIDQPRDVCRSVARG